MRDFWQDVQYGLRTLRKSPGFTAVALLTLAIGIGANTAIFSFVDGVLLKPLPYANADRIMRVLEKPPGSPDARNGISTLNFLDWQRQNSVFQYMAARTGGSVTLTGSGNPVQLRGQRMSAHGFDILGVQAVLGRTFAADEDQPGKSKVAVLSNALWASQFGSDPAVVGRVIQLDNEPHVVIGVLPAGSAFDRTFAQIFRPLVFEPQNMTRNFHWFGAMGLLKPGVTVEKAKAEMDAIGQRIARDYPDSNKGWSVAVDPLAEVVVGPQLRKSLYVLLAAVGMVLLIGCANLANLTLARGTVREREVAIRVSVGASRWRLIQQFLTESVLLSYLGGVLGVALGYALIAGLKAALPPFSLPSEATITLDSRVLLFAIGLSILTGLVFGLAPAIQATRSDLAGSMKEGSRGSSTGGAKHRLRSALVVTEVALAFLLLAGSGLLIRSFFAMQQVATGFNTENVITAGLPTSEKRFATPEALNTYLRQVVANLESLPGVRDVALTSALPMQGWGYGMPFQIADKPIVDRANRKACFFKMVTPSYFRTIGMTFVKGRGLAEGDGKGAPPVTVINETMARKHFPNEEPVGKRILIQEIVPGKTALGPEIPWEVVGVVKDEKVGSLDETDSSPGMYVSKEQSPTFGQALVIRAAMDPRRLQNAITDAVHQVNKDQALTDFKTLEQIKAESMADNRLNSIMLGGFAMVALLLSAIGIYGVISYSVVQRTHEIGIRAAMGARAGDVVGLILKRGVVMAALGLGIGLLGALALTHLLATLLFGVGARDPLTLGAVAAVLAFVALLASYLPARRAAKVDPMICLRYE
ncbi:ABC transporter permease [Paludibaculum fermentans]|uniref:ABC transporter permease n=1 Tax=Paludibaculum fermentans TaxID=1473598 RepID=A0A7S7NVH4_PALFE|nr:ABC transporter permease [Paludibaculum fermentans]QOY90573.1 ABC transporter permease [Paludibaculum fermentans]